MLLSTVRRFTQWMTPATPTTPATPAAPDPAELRIKRADAQNLLQQLQQELGQLEDDARILEARYHGLLRSGQARQAGMVLQQIADIEQSMTLKTNRASEIGEIAQLLQWDEIQQATDFVHAAYSADLQQTQQRMAERIARQSVRRNQLYDLAHMVKDSEADSARMADAAHDALRSRLAQTGQTESTGQTGVPLAPLAPPRVPLPHQATAARPHDKPSGIGPGPGDACAMDQDSTWCAPPAR